MIFKNYLNSLDPTERNDGGLFKKLADYVSILSQQQQAGIQNQGIVPEQNNALVRRDKNPTKPLPIAPLSAQQTRPSVDLSRLFHTNAANNRSPVSGEVVYGSSQPLSINEQALNAFAGVGQKRKAGRSFGVSGASKGAA